MRAIVLGLAVAALGLAWQGYGAPELGLLLSTSFCQ